MTSERYIFNEDYEFAELIADKKELEEAESAMTIKEVCDLLNLQDKKIQKYAKINEKQEQEYKEQKENIKYLEEYIAELEHDCRELQTKNKKLEQENQRLIHHINRGYK